MRNTRKKTGRSQPAFKIRNAVDVPPVAAIRASLTRWCGFASRL
jgi:hypothetical protein